MEDSTSIVVPRAVARGLALLHVDFRPRRTPDAPRILLATVVAVAASLAADALLVRVGTALFPSTKGYVHFQFPDYARLTVIGVVIACGAWPVTQLLTSRPRWLFLRMAVLVTLVLLVPDLYLLYLGQPRDAVAVLMCMHVAIAVVTYGSLTRLAPGRLRGADRAALLVVRTRAD